MAPVVPIIDMSDFEARRDEVTAQLMEAAENIGFFQVRMQAAMQLCGAHGRQPTHELRLAPWRPPGVHAQHFGVHSMLLLQPNTACS